MGAAVGSPAVAALLGLPLHLAGDRVPHRDIPNRRFEVASGVLLVTLLGARRGVRDAAAVGALAAHLAAMVTRDLAHQRKAEPAAHRRGWHRSGRLLPVPLQLVLAGVLVGRLLGTPGR